MRFNLPYAAVGLALALGAPAAHAQTVAAVPQPLYNAAPAGVVAPVADIYPAPAYGSTSPLYDAAPAPVPPAPIYGYSSYGYSNYGYSTPVYDVAPAAVAPAPVVAAPVATQPIIYRYVYEPDRILVIDPATNIAVQAIPR